MADMPSFGVRVPTLAQRLSVVHVVASVAVSPATRHVSQNLVVPRRVPGAGNATTSGLVPLAASAETMSANTMSKTAPTRGLSAVGFPFRSKREPDGGWIVSSRIALGTLAAVLVVLVVAGQLDLSVPGGSATSSGFDPQSDESRLRIALDAWSGSARRIEMAQVRIVRGMNGSERDGASQRRVEGGTLDYASAAKGTLVAATERTEVRKMSSTTTPCGVGAHANLSSTTTSILPLTHADIAGRCASNISPEISPEGSESRLALGRPGEVVSDSEPLHFNTAKSSNAQSNRDADELAMAALAARAIAQDAGRVPPTAASTPKKTAKPFNHSASRQSALISDGTVAPASAHSDKTRDAEGARKSDAGISLAGPASRIGAADVGRDVTAWSNSAARVAVREAEQDWTQRVFDGN